MICAVEHLEVDDSASTLLLLLQQIEIRRYHGSGCLVTDEFPDLHMRKEFLDLRIVAGTAKVGDGLRHAVGDVGHLNVSVNPFVHDLADLLGGHVVN